ncbi:MAG: lipid A export permease/ATP-binding protein MsbA [Gammaproteobacteria bacterium]|nr:MAG: lipid A export permease/ATP-binding protein MsbA [Gammaproteobacteria bacterium]
MYRRLFGYAWPYKSVFLLSVLGALILSATAAGFAALMKPLMDEGFVGRRPDAILYIPVALVGLFILRGVGNFLSQYAISWVGRRIIADVRGDVFAHVLRLPCGFYDLHPSGMLLSKMLFDVEQIANAVNNAIFVIIRDGLTVLALFGLMLYLNWKLAFIFVVLAPVSALLIRVMSRRFRKTAHRIQASMSEISQVTQEATEGQRVVKAFGAQGHEIAAFAAANERNRGEIMRKTAISAIGVPLVQLIASFALAFAIYVALSMGDVTPGIFVAFIAAISSMINPAKRLTEVNEVIQTSLAAASSVFSLLDEPAEPDTGTAELANVKGRIEYRDVHFRYPAGATDALAGVSFAIEPGQTVALVGASGSGKTTCASLLPRFYSVTGGAILLDGVSLNDLKLANLRTHLALVGQETLLFDDTIKNNIAYGAPSTVDEARLMEAARAAHVLEFVERMPAGLDTHVGAKGLRLSGGQRQRIAIARALYKNAPILILDEATSALDTESERYVQDAMRKLMQNRTTLVIAHRLSTVEHADRIVVLSQGRVAETGTHAELLARNGIYAGLYRNQFNDAAA